MTMSEDPRGERERVTVTMIALEDLLASIDGDRDLFAQLCDSGFLAADARSFDAAQAEAARVARTLVRELEVNWPGVEIILRMRAELLDMHTQVADLLRLLRDARAR